MIDLTNLGTSIFATGIGATLITQCKGSIKTLFQFFRIGYSIIASSEANLRAYCALRNYILENKGSFHKTASFENYENNNEKQLGFGNFLCFPQWNQLMLIEHQNNKRSNSPSYQTLCIKIFGFNSKKIYNEIIKRVEENTNSNDLIIRTTDYYGSSTFAPRRDFSTICHPQVDKIIKFLDSFLTKKEIYQKNGIPYKTGILLYGPPGTGKTSIIKAIATYLNYKILILGSDLELPYDCQKAVVCVEDIDRFLKEENENNDDNGISKISIQKINKLHKLLQLFDGLSSPSNIIFVATTNHIEDLPEELIRDGRFDCKICLNNIEKKYAEKMCDNFGVALNEIVSVDEKYPINPAYLQNKILQKLNPIKEI